MATLCVELRTRVECGLGRCESVTATTESAAPHAEDMRVLRWLPVMRVVDSGVRMWLSVQRARRPTGLSAKRAGSRMCMPELSVYGTTA